MIKIKYFLITIALILFSKGFSQNQSNLLFEDYDPPSTLIVKETIITKAKFPFIDIHNHIFDMNKFDFEATLLEMEKLNMRIFNNLSGRGFNIERIGDSITGIGILDRPYFLKSTPLVDNKIKRNFILFTNIDFSGFDQPQWLSNTIKSLEDDINAGAQGLKIYKDLGLTLKDQYGKRIPVSHPKLDAIWKKCGELKIPVLIHTGEPSSFFQPHDSLNERWLELKQFPSRARPSTKYPSWETLMKEQHEVFKNNPQTIFINAHMGWMANDLKRLGELLEEIPNMYVEIAAAVAELGRQPISARVFFVKYQDRILFGKDTYKPEEYHTYFRILESNDEYFKYFRKRHAFWRMYGLNLPDEVLEKVYYKNALIILPNIDKSMFNE